MDLPRFYFFELSGITAVYGGRIFKPNTQLPDSEDSISRDRIYIPSLFDDNAQNETAFPLEPQETLVGLEILYYLCHNNELGKWQSNFLRRFDISSLTDIDLKNKIKESKLLEFIVRDVFSRFSSSGQMDLGQMGIKLDSAPKRPKSTPTAPARNRDKQGSGLVSTIFDMMSSQHEGYIENDLERIRDTEETHSVLGQVLDEEDVCLIDSHLYLMSRQRRGDRDYKGIRLVIGGEELVLAHYLPISKIEERFRSGLEEELKTKAMRNNPVMLRHIELHERLLKEIKDPKYAGMGLSLIKDSDDGTKYIVCLDVPEFVNEGDDGDFFYFPATKVGLEVSIDQTGEIQHGKKPIVLGKYKHPFIGDWAINKDICTDNYRSNQDTPEAEIMDYLVTAKGILTSGYFGDVRPRRSLTRSNFEENVFKKVAGMSREEILKRYQITNRR